MWCWQDQDVIVANTNEAGSRQRSIKSMCYKSCELLPTMIAAAAFRAQPGSKVQYISLAGTVDCARLQSLQGVHNNTCQSPRTNNTNNEMRPAFQTPGFGSEQYLSFPLLGSRSDTINNAILSAVQLVPH